MSAASLWLALSTANAQPEDVWYVISRNACITLSQAARDMKATEWEQPSDFLASAISHGLILQNQRVLQQGAVVIYEFVAPNNREVEFNIEIMKGRAVCDQTLDERHQQQN